MVASCLVDAAGSALAPLSVPLRAGTRGAGTCHLPFSARNQRLNPSNTVVLALKPPTGITLVKDTAHLLLLFFGRLILQ